MTDYPAEMQRLVEDFVQQLTDLYQRAVQSTLGGGGRGRGGARASSPGRAKGEKRSSDELDGLADRFHEFVAKNPGLRIEQINKQLGTTTKDLALPIRKLISTGVITTKGKKRSTTYFAGKKAAKN